MVKQENMPNAYKEVYVIVNSMGQKDIDKVPKDFMNMLEENMNNNYEFVINGNEDFEKMEILQETKTLLMYLFMNFWATDQQKEKIRKKFRNDIINEEKNKGNFDSNKLFNDLDKNKDINKVEDNKKTTAIIETKKESIFSKIAKLFAKFLKKNN